MALTWQDIVKKDLSKGIDSYSSPTNIKDGWSEDLVNVDSEASGQLPKRVGYLGHKGWIPLRAKEITHSGTQITLTFDDSQAIDLSVIGSSPLIVNGIIPTSLSGSGDFSGTEATRYYDSFSVDNRDTLAVGSNTITKAASQHGLSTPYIFTGLAESDDTLNNHHTVIIPDEVNINETSYSVDVDYTNAVASEGFFYFLDKSAEAGTTYIHTVTAPATSVTISAATHGLSNFNIGVKCFDDISTSGTITEIIPDEITINGSGEVVVTFSSNFPDESGGNGTAYIVLTAVPLANIYTDSATTGTNTFSFSVDEPFNFYYIYYYDAPNSVFRSVLPNNISYDADTGQVSVKYSLATATETVEIYYEPAEIIANSITLTDTTGTSENYTTTAPQLTVWGISHDQIYKSAAIKGGHVNHIDNYRSSGEEWIVSGLGGNLFKANPYTSANATTYLYPTTYVNGRERVDGDTNVAPLFDVDGSSVTRTRGLVTDATIRDNTALITAATYVSDEVVDYTFAFTSKTGSIVDGTEIDVGYDTLTISGMANAAHNGTFVISSIQSDSSTATVIRCANTNIHNNNKDETDAKGRGGVFTGKLSMEAAPPFIAGDSLTSSALSSSVVISAVNGTDVYLSSTTSELEFPDGVRCYVSRTTSVVPMRDSEGTATVENYVKGDIVNASSIASNLRVVGINTNSNIAFTITGDGTTATATSVGAHNLQQGMSIFIYGTNGEYDGEKVIASVPTSTALTFVSSSTTSKSGTVIGKTLELDTSITISDGSVGDRFQVDGRWLSIEAPPAVDDNVKETYIHHFDAKEYDNQDTLRSVMVSDNMYFTNQSDEVMKYDGSYVYRASLPRWQPQLFTQFDTNTSSLLKGFVVPYTAVSTTGKTFRIASPVFSAGDRVYDTDTDSVFTVTEVVVVPGSTDVYDVVVAEDTSSITTGGTDTLTLVKTYKYYARLNYIDSNNNITASAATGHNDMIVEQVSDGQFHHKLVGMPVYDNYDYERIEIELYRTRANSAAPFYLVKRESIGFNNSDGYIEFEDGTPDELLKDVDVVHSALLGVELGTTWKQPIRASHITSISNRLVLANLKGLQELDFSILPTGSSVSASNISGLTFLFRKDSTDTGTATDMVNRAKFEFVTSGAVSITPNTDIDNASNSGYFDITSTTHGLTAGDWIYAYHNATGTNNDLQFSGWWQVASAPDADTIRINSSTGTAAASTADIDRYVAATTESDIPVWLGTDGNYNQKDGNTSGSYEYVSTLRLSNAVNTVMRMTDITISGYESFVPWMMGGSGNDFALGQFVITAPNSIPTTMEVVIGTVGSTYTLFVNNIARSSSEVVGALTEVFPSRVIVSYPNFPEVFDNPEGSDNNSDSVIDVNVSDGQEITGIIPFFGDSTYGGAQLNEIVVVFKTNSIYVLNTTRRDYQKIDSRGLGCTAPNSIAPTRNGVIFANQSGIYRLDRNMQVSYVGKYMQGKWKDSVNKDSLSVATATQYGTGRQYKLSVPIDSATENSQVYVYSHDREGSDMEYGAWTRYDNHPTTGWANQGNKSFFASTSGDVFRIRDSGDKYDYRDDASAINTTITLRPDDFDLPGARKVIRAVVSTVKHGSDGISSLNVLTATNLSDTFESAGSITNTSSDRGEPIRSSLSKRKCTFIQTKYTHSTIDEGFTLSGMTYIVGRLDVRGTRQASDRS